MFPGHDLDLGHDLGDVPTLTNDAFGAGGVVEVSTPALGAMLQPIDRASLPQDLAEWITLCESGGLYRELAKFINRGKGDKELTRDEIKEAVFKWILFGSVPRPGSKGRAFYDAFAARFPTVASYLRRMKELGPALESAAENLGPHLPAKWARGRPARISQRLESWLVVYVAVAGLRARYPQMPIVTCHDSVLTTEEYADIAVRAIKEVFAELGLNVRVKREGTGSEHHQTFKS
jgi:hypothetical protein